MDDKKEIIEEESTTIPKADVPETVPEEYGEFSDQGMVAADEPVSYAQGGPNYSQSGLINDFATGFKEGIKMGKGEIPVEKKLAKGAKQGMKPADANEQNKDAVASKSKDTPTDNRNAALGKQLPKADNQNSKMPGAKPNEKKKPNEKLGQKKAESANKSTGMGRKLFNSSPLGRGMQAAAQAAKGMQQEGERRSLLKTLWMNPTTRILMIKAIIIGGTVLIAGIVVVMLIIALLGGTTAAIAGASCNSNEYVTSTGTDADVMSFMKEMQAPLKNVSVTSLFGWREYDNYDHLHNGVDLAANCGTPVYAAGDGKVILAEPYSGYGNSVQIQHGGTITTWYAHLSRIMVSKGATVRAGQQIGLSGNTGGNYPCHLHFEVRTGTAVEDGVSPNPYFGYSDKGYEICLDRNADKSKIKACGLPLTGNARKLGDDGFIQITQKTNSYTSDMTCCSTYSSSVSSEHVDGLPPILTQEFVNGAIQSQSKYGVPASLTLAQIVLESSGSSPGGLSGLAYQCKNLFGIKGTGSAGSCNFATSEQTTSGVSFGIHANFRKYNNYSESIDDHAELLTGSIYTPCTKTAKTADEWAHAIKKCGYATDVNYAPKLIKIMKDYNLYQYDDASVFGSGTTQCDATNSGYGGSGDIVGRALEEYEKWQKVSASERTEMLKNYMQACGYGRQCADWCAGFVSYILQETGKLDQLTGYSCMAMSYKNVKAKSGSSVTVTHHTLSSGYVPKPGDVIIFGNRHVGLVEKVEGNTIHTIEGNTGTNPRATCWTRSIDKHANARGSRGMTDFVTIS